MGRSWTACRLSVHSPFIVRETFIGRSGDVGGVPMGSSLVLAIFCRVPVFRRIFMVYPCMGCQGTFTSIPRAVHGRLTGTPPATDGLLMDTPWICHEYPTDTPRTPHDISRASHGHSMGVPWTPRQHLTDNPWKLSDTPWKTHGHTMGIPHGHPTEITLTVHGHLYNTPPALHGRRTAAHEHHMDNPRTPHGMQMACP